jgi:hypothetical protein
MTTAGRHLRLRLDLDFADLNGRLDFGVIVDIRRDSPGMGAEGRLKVGHRVEIEMVNGNKGRP